MSSDGLRRAAAAGAAALAAAVDDDDAAAASSSASAAAATPLTESTVVASELERLQVSSDWRIDWKRVQMGPVIGHGAFGEVFKGTWAGVNVVLKRMVRPVFVSGGAASQREEGPEERSPEEQALEKEFVHEVNMLKQLRHPHVVLFMGVTIGPPPAESSGAGGGGGGGGADGGSGATRRQMYIVQEFVAGGSLVNHLAKKEKTISWGARIKMALEIAGALSYLHEVGIIHRDLKAENVLVEVLSSGGRSGDAAASIDATHDAVRCKVADFGLATLQQGSVSEEVGSCWWRAPEVGSGEYGFPADVFSFGVVVAEIVTRDAAEDIRLSMAYQRPGRVEFGVKPEMYLEEYAAKAADAPQALLDITLRCCREDPAGRPTSQQLVDELRQLHDDYQALEAMAEEQLSSKDGVDLWVTLCSSLLKQGSEDGGTQRRTAAEASQLGVPRKQILEALTDRITRFSNRTLSANEQAWIMDRFFPAAELVDLPTFTTFWRWYAATEIAIRNRRILPYFSSGWIKGFMGKEGACEALQENGDFLARFSESQPGNLVFTCLCNDTIRHMLLHVKDMGGIVVGEKLYRSLEALMAAEGRDLKSVGATVADDDAKKSASSSPSAAAGSTTTTAAAAAAGGNEEAGDDDDDDEAPPDVEFTRWDSSRFADARATAAQDPDQQEVTPYGDGYTDRVMPGGAR